MSQSAVVVETAQPARLTRRRTSVRTVIGGTLGLLVVLLLLVGPLVIGKSPYALNTDIPFAGFSSEHWLGTDQLGRDIASRIAYGGRGTVLIALGTVSLASAVALPLGVLTGYIGGTFDLVVTRVIDLFFAIPSLLIAIGIVGLLGPSVRTTILALGFSFWAAYARLVRSVVVNVRSRPYVDACRVLGASRLRIIRTEIWTGITPLVILQTTVLLGLAILDEAALGFLGLGVQPPQPSWGSLLADSRQFILSHPGQGIIVGIPIMAAVFALNLLADSLRDWLDARRTA